VKIPPTPLLVKGGERFGRWGVLWACKVFLCIVPIYCGIGGSLSTEGSWGETKDRAGMWASCRGIGSSEEVKMRCEAPGVKVKGKV